MPDVRAGFSPMLFSFRATEPVHKLWGGTPVLRPTTTSACSRVERLVPKRAGRVLEDPRRPGGLPHKLRFQEEDAHHAPVLQTSQIRVSLLSPRDVRERADRPVLVGLVANSGAAYAEMEDFLTPARSLT